LFLIYLLYCSLFQQKQQQQQQNGKKILFKCFRIKIMTRRNKNETKKMNFQQKETKKFLQIFIYFNQLYFIVVDHF
jgi:hypothetical protein